MKRLAAFKRNETNGQSGEGKGRGIAGVSSGEVIDSGDSEDGENASGDVLSGSGSAPAVRTSKTDKGKGKETQGHPRPMASDHHDGGTAASETVHDVPSRETVDQIEHHANAILQGKNHDLECNENWLKLAKEHLGKDLDRSERERIGLEASEVEAMIKSLRQDVDKLESQLRWAHSWRVYLQV